MLCLASGALAQGTGLGDRIGKASSLGDQYSDFNTRLMTIQTVKSLPFFNKTPTERLSAIRGYYDSARTGNVRGVASSVQNDFSNGGLVKDVGIALATNVLTQVSQGKSIDDSVSKTISYMTTPEYLLGNLMGGTMGAALGSLIPVPIVGGFLGQLMMNVPAMTGAMLGSNVGSKFVHGVRTRNLDMGEIVRSLDWTSLIFQSIGATAGMLIGNSLPVPFLGQLVGGVLGGTLGLKVATWVKARLHIGTTASDWIATPQYDPAKIQLPPWASIPGAIPPTSGASSAPAAPVSTASVVELQMKDAMRRYTDAEQAGAKPVATRAFAEYAALRSRLDQLRKAR